MKGRIRNVPVSVMRNDMKILHHAQQLRMKWLMTRGNLSDSEYEKSAQIRKRFWDITLRGLKSKKEATIAVLRLSALHFLATDYFAGYFVALIELIGRGTELSLVSRAKNSQKYERSTCTCYCKQTSIRKHEPCSARCGKKFIAIPPATLMM